MKKLVMVLGALMTLVSLTACPSKGSKNSGFGVNNCLNYTYNPQTGTYYDPRTGQAVQCNTGSQYGLNNGLINPYNSVVGGTYANYQDNCVAYGLNWHRVYVQGQGYVCVQRQYFYNQIPGFQSYQTYYGGFPTYARTCQVGANCGGCIGGSSFRGNGNLWLGGTLALCF